jgi:serine/threonine protein kinase
MLLVAKLKEILDIIQKDILHSEKPFDFVIRSGSRAYDGFITILFFSKGTPLFIAKIARENGTILEREAHNIFFIRNVLKESILMETIEKPLYFGTVGNRAVLIKQYLEGDNALNYVTHQRNDSKYISIMIDWLVNLQHISLAYNIFDEKKKKQKVQTYLESGELSEYSKIFIEDNQFYLGFTHNDLVPSNILISKNHVSGVLDFEYFERDGILFCDFFGLFPGIVTAKFGFTSRALDFFFQNKRFKEMLKNAFNRYGVDMNLDAKKIFKIFPLYADKAICLTKQIKMHNLLRFQEKFRDNLLSWD